jgi:transcriptional regulator with XRE-family HTH domain
MGEARTAGDRVREARKQRGLTQRGLAGRSGVSVSLIRKLEQGDYPAQVRLETLHKLAAVLAVPTSALAAGARPEEPERSESDSWDPVRRALHAHPLSPGEPGEEPTLEGVGQVFGLAVAAVRDNRFGRVRALLPGLLRDTEVLVAVSGSGTGVRARRLRSQIRQLAAYMLSQTWQFTAASEAIELASADAADDMTAMAAADWKCWTLLRQGQLGQAYDLAVRWAEDAEPRISSASRDQLAAWGRFLIRVTTAAVRDNRPQEAREALRLAQVAAAGTGIDVIPRFNRWQVFGPVTVAMFAAQNALVQDHPEITVATGRQLQDRPFPLAETWNRHRLDVARAYTMLRQHTEAAAVLHQIRGTAPEWLAQQRYARDTLTRIIGRRRTLTPEMRDLATFLHLTP